MFSRPQLSTIDTIAATRGPARERAGPRVAAILSVIETCRRLDLPIRQYLRSVLPGLAEFPANRVSERTPASWTRRRN